MKNIRCLLTLSVYLYLANSALAQQRTQTPLRLDIDAYNNEVHVLQSEGADGFTMFLQDKQAVWALKVNDSLKVEVPARCVNPSATRGNLRFIGGIHYGDSSSLLYGNKKLTKILWHTVNYLNGLSRQEEVKLVYDKKEKALCYYAFNNKFYVITSNPTSSTLGVRTLFLGSSVSESDKEVKSEQSKVIQIHRKTFTVEKSILIDMKSLQVVSPFEFSENQNLSSPQETNSFNLLNMHNAYSSYKVYPFENEVIVTIDDDTRFTKTITLDLSSGEKFSQKYSQESLASSTLIPIKSNSFITNSQLFQVKAN